jgi:hypothetical protein
MSETNIPTKPGPDRRALIRGIAIAGASGIVTSAQDETAPRATAAPAPVMASYANGIVETSAGNVPGYRSRGVLVFRAAFHTVRRPVARTGTMLPGGRIAS